MSRQRKWQIKKNKQGLCELCGKPRGRYRFLCDRDMTKWLKLQRNRQRAFRGNTKAHINLLEARRVHRLKAAENA